MPATKKDSQQPELVSKINQVLNELALPNSILHTGLGIEETEQRKSVFGKNKLSEKNGNEIFTTLIKQFQSGIVLILLAGSIISWIAHEYINFYVILAVIFLVVVLGFIQEYSAQRSIKALKKIVEVNTKVLRNNIVSLINIEELVPGDIVHLEAGDVIPADGIVVNAISGSANESSLTGESYNVEKSTDDLVYASTLLTTGKMTFLVTHTGMNTKIGEIADSLQEKEEKTPLQKKIDEMSKKLAFIGLGATLLTLILGIFQGAEFTELLIIALTLAVATVPEGLPLTLTITLSSGVRRLAKNNAVVRKLIGVETLGSTTVICTDKTGTLTENKMYSEFFYNGEQLFQFTGRGYNPQGEIKKIVNYPEENNLADFKAENYILENPLILNKMTEIAKAANNSQIYKADDDSYAIMGDPTEGALLTLSEKSAQILNTLHKNSETEHESIDLEIYEEQNRLIEHTFTSERKMMSTVYNIDGNLHVYAKGAFEEIFAKSNSIEIAGKKKKINSKILYDIEKTVQLLSSNAYRVIALAYKKHPKSVSLDYLKDQEHAESDLVFIGVVAMRDPVRLEAYKAIESAFSAGIEVKMITGDNALTAKSIANQLNMIDDNSLNYQPAENSNVYKFIKDKVITGSELEQLTDSELTSILPYIKVFARIKPDQKYRIVESLQNMGEVVAMTGDGVNDAPALRKAEIGIAMGKSGTDVARETSTMVLKDDNFATIVEAVKQGRGIYENIEKFIIYLVSQNFNEVILILLAIALLDVKLLPLTALQILFINILDEIIPSIALGMSAPRANIMESGPRDKNQPLLSKTNLILILGSALYMGISVFILYLLQNPQENLNQARTVTFMTITLFTSFLPFSFIDLYSTATKFYRNTTTTILLWVGMIVSLTSVAIMMYIPEIAKIFELVPLSPIDWIISLLIVFGGSLWIRVLKGLMSSFYLEPFRKSQKQSST